MLPAASPNTNVFSQEGKYCKVSFGSTRKEGHIHFSFLVMPIKKFKLSQKQKCPPLASTALSPFKRCDSIFASPSPFLRISHNTQERHNPLIWDILKLLGQKASLSSEGLQSQERESCPVPADSCFLPVVIFSFLVMQRSRESSDNRVSFLLSTYFWGVSLEPPSLNGCCCKVAASGKLFVTQSKDAPRCWNFLEARGEQMHRNSKLRFP